MGEFKLKVRTANAASKDDYRSEICRILRDTARRIDEGEIDGTIRDIGGNRVGYYVAE